MLCCVGFGGFEKRAVGPLYFWLRDKRTNRHEMCGFLSLTWAGKGEGCGFKKKTLTIFFLKKLIFLENFLNF